MRSPPSTFAPTVRSPQPVPSPRQHQVPSPRTSLNHPIPSPQYTHSPHLAPGQPTGLPSDQSQMNTEQIMLSQLQTSHGNMVTQDMGLGNKVDEVTPLTPQDQLSKFVDQL